MFTGKTFFIKASVVLCVSNRVVTHHLNSETHHIIAMTHTAYNIENTSPQLVCIFAKPL